MVRGAQAVLSPGGLALGVAGPSALAGVASGTGRTAAIARLIADTPARALAAELGGEIAAEAATEAGAPLPVALGAGLLGGVAGAGVAAGAGAVRRSGREILPVGTAQALDETPTPSNLGRRIIEIANTPDSTDVDIRTVANRIPDPQLRAAATPPTATAIRELYGATDPNQVMALTKRQVANSTEKFVAAQPAIEKLQALVRERGRATEADRLAIQETMNRRARQPGQLAGMCSREPETRLWLQGRRQLNFRGRLYPTSSSSPKQGLR